MDIYTVSFFGHREVERASEIEGRLNLLLHYFITQKQYVEFLVGRGGEFDQLAASAIRQAVKQYGCSNTSLVLVLPYMKNEVEICSYSSDAHYKSAIQVRNRCMFDRSDMVVCCIQHKSGGAYKTIQYAKNIIRR